MGDAKCKHSMRICIIVFVHSRYIRKNYTIGNFDRRGRVTRRWLTLLIVREVISLLPFCYLFRGPKGINRDRSGLMGLEIIGGFSQSACLWTPDSHSQRGGRGFKSHHLHQQNLKVSGCWREEPHPDIFLPAGLLPFLTGRRSASHLPQRSQSRHGQRSCHQWHGSTHRL